jgi:hypothetical protein
MKKFTSIAIAFLLALSVVPAMAADQAGSDREPVTSQALDKAPLTFQAFTKLPAMEREAITPLTDTELAAIEGSVDICVVCLNIAVITQTNVNTGNATGVGIGGVFGDGIGVGAINQSNSARVRQDIN